MTLSWSLTCGLLNCFTWNIWRGTTEGPSLPVANFVPKLLTAGLVKVPRGTFLMQEQEGAGIIGNTSSGSDLPSFSSLVHLLDFYPGTRINEEPREKSRDEVLGTRVRSG